MLWNFIVWPFFNIKKNLIGVFGFCLLVNCWTVSWIFLTLEWKIFSNLVRHQGPHLLWEDGRTPPERVNKFNKGKGQIPDFQDITRRQPMIFFLIWLYTLFVSPKTEIELIYPCGQWFSLRHTYETFPSTVHALSAMVQPNYFISLR